MRQSGRHWRSTTPTSRPATSPATFDIRYITGLGSVDGPMLSLLDIEKLIPGADIALGQSLGALNLGSPAVKLRSFICAQVGPWLRD